MNIIISGYGRMGREIEKICQQRNHKIIAVIDNEQDWNKLDHINYSDAVVIDFSLPNTALSNFARCFKLSLKVVTGTTGWYPEVEDVKKMCKQFKGTFFYASNFSIGVNLFFKANDYLSKIMAGINNYNVHINETHHIHKIDAPSGTAISTAEGIIKNNNALNSWELNKDEEHDKIPIFAFRQGEVTGKHEVIYESNVDKITLSHEAKNRSGFAQGAVIAAEFINNKIGFFTMDDLMINFI
jgi:4-hydroxy-tetrahydrodipicolinate reductase